MVGHRLRFTSPDGRGGVVMSANGISHPQVSWHRMPLLSALPSFQFSTKLYTYTSDTSDMTWWMATFSSRLATLILLTGYKWGYSTLYFAWESIFATLKTCRAGCWICLITDWLWFHILPFPKTTGWPDSYYINFTLCVWRLPIVTLANNSSY